MKAHLSSFHLPREMQSDGFVRPAAHGMWTHHSGEHILLLLSIRASRALLSQAAISSAFSLSRQALEMVLESRSSSWDRFVSQPLFMASLGNAAAL